MFILLLTLFVSPILAELVIRPSESPLTRDQYKSFVALCSSQSSSRVGGWRSPQQKNVSETGNDRVIVERQTNGLRLRIRNLTTDDQGTWECFGTDARGQPIRKTLQINIRAPVTFHGESIQYAPLGEAMVIQCRVQASPLAEITWFKGPEKNRIENAEHQLVNDGLRIKKIDLSNNDTYWCRGDVLETGESRDYPIQLIVSKPIGPARITCATPCAIEKKTATLICEASGLPPPKYLWFYGSADDGLRPIKDSPVGASEVPKFVVRGNQLTINYVDETDNGRYSCHAFNEFDRKGQRAEYNMSVIVPPRLSPIAPVEINLDPQHPQRVSFPCRVERGSSESLSLEWQYFNGTPIVSTHGIVVDKSQYEANKLIELRFDPVQREHFGNYSCVAKNLADSTYSTASLYIQFAPIYVGPNVKTIASIPNYRSTLRCRFESYPSPQIQWIKMSRTVQDPEGRILAVGIDNGVNDITTKQIGFTLYESTLSYSPADRDFGLSFECRALNPRLGRHSFTFQRAQPPKKVIITEVKPFASSADILIQASDTSDLPLTQYTVRYGVQDSTESQWKTVNVPAQTDSHQQRIKIEHLRPSTSYQFNVVAESHAGVGQAMGPVSFRTLDRQRPDFLIESNANETCLDDRTCVISWSIQSDGGAPIVRTEVSYAQINEEQSADDESNFNPIVSIDPSAIEYELRALKPDTHYLVLIRLFNEAGMTERKTRVKTLKERLDTDPRRKSSLIMDYRKAQPSKWVVVGIVLAILMSALILVSVCIVLRVRRTNGKDTTASSDHQTTPMMDGEDHPNSAHGYKNGHSISVKLDDAAC